MAREQMSATNILFTSAGRRVSLIKIFRESLYDLRNGGKIVSTDIRRNAPAGFVSDVRISAPRVDAEEYIDFLLEICRKYKIKLLIPLIDTELQVLSSHVEEFKEIGTEVLVSNSRVNQICFDKRLTYKFFVDNDIPTPDIYDISYAMKFASDRYPLMIKPATGSGSVGVTRVFSKNELEFFSGYIENSVIQEFIVGDEYTFDVLVDFSGKVRCVVPRLRMEVRAGEVSKSMTVKDEDLMYAGRNVVEKLGAGPGCITVQCIKRRDGSLKFIEINPRFGGGFPLANAAGANYPRWILQFLSGKTPKIGPGSWSDGVVMLRYDSEIFTTRDNI